MHGRDDELAILTGLCARARDGHAAAIVLRGEPGIGKTTLLDHIATIAEYLRVLRVTGVETETELPYAALHQLLRPALDRLDVLPAAQRTALEGALGLAEPVATDRFMVGLAVLGLLAELSTERPLLCIADDAHWIDHESGDALLFAVRRLHAEPVAVLFAARDDGGAFPAPGIPELRLTGIPRDSAERLLTEHQGGLTLPVRDRLLDEARGNPLALLELPRALTPGQQAGELPPLTFSFDAAQNLTGRVLHGFRERVEALSQPARVCLLAASLDSSGDRDALLRAAAYLGSTLDDFAAVERAGLLQVGSDRVELRHPLVRVAAQATSDIGLRTRVHLALAEATDGDRRTWHLTHAATGPDDVLAAELDGLAERASRRGALSVAATAAERAASLSPDPAVRTRRLTYAATLAVEAGQLDRAAQLVRAAERGPAEAATARPLAGVRALIEYERGLPRRAARILVEQAAPLITEAPATLVSTLARAAVYTWNAGHHHEQQDLFDRIEHHAATVAGTHPGLSGLVRGLRLTTAGDVAEAVPALREYTSKVDDDAQFPQRLAATYASFVLGDQHRARDLATALIAEFHAKGRLTLLPQPLGLLATAQAALDAVPDAQATVAEALRLAEDTGQRHRVGHLIGLSAWLHAIVGDDVQARVLAEEAIGGSAGGERMAALAWAIQALTAADVQDGRYAELLDRLDKHAEGPARHSLTVLIHTVPDQVEAAVRHGEPERAAIPLARFTTWAKATGLPWAKGTALRCAALCARDDNAADLYTRALVEHARDTRPIEHARTHLTYGEWLRRRQRRTEAGIQLDHALALFESVGARAWATRTTTELRATGLGGTTRRTDRLASLTPQELQVVRLAATGASNRDIATRLFLSPRTVGYHLYKAFPKLGVSSRAELAAHVIGT